MSTFSGAAFIMRLSKEACPSFRTQEDPGDEAGEKDIPVRYPANALYHLSEQIRGGTWMKSWGIALIAIERFRQMELKGWTPEYDVERHKSGELALAGAVYALPDYLPRTKAELWPWPSEDYRSHRRKPRNSFRG